MAENDPKLTSYGLEKIACPLCARAALHGGTLAKSEPLTVVWGHDETEPPQCSMRRNASRKFGLGAPISVILVRSERRNHCRFGLRISDNERDVLLRGRRHRT